MIETERAAFIAAQREFNKWLASLAMPYAKYHVDLTPHPMWANTFADERTQRMWNAWPGRLKLLEENDGTQTRENY